MFDSTFFSNTLGPDNSMDLSEIFRDNTLFDGVADVTDSLPDDHQLLAGTEVDIWCQNLDVCLHGGPSTRKTSDSMEGERATARSVRLPIQSVHILRTSGAVVIQGWASWSKKNALGMTSSLSQSRNSELQTQKHSAKTWCSRPRRGRKSIHLKPCGDPHPWICPSSFIPIPRIVKKVATRNIHPLRILWVIDSVVHLLPPEFQAGKEGRPVHPRRIHA